MAENFYDLFAATARTYANQVAVEVQRPHQFTQLTYSELFQLAERASLRLAAVGVGRGDRCAIFAENSAEWCAAFLGILRLGAVAVPLDTAYKPEQIAILLRDSEACVVLTTPQRLDAVEKASGLAEKTVKAILLNGNAPGKRSLESGAPPSSQSAGCPATQADRAVVLYTSGTTSDPKGVVLTHGNLLAEIKAALGALRFDHGDTILGVLPLFHSLSQMANLLAPFAVGARVVLLESVSSGEIVRALKERNASVFCCVPQFFYLLHQRIQRELEAAGWLARQLFRVGLWVNGQCRKLGINLGPFLFRRIHRLFGSSMRLLITGGSRFEYNIGFEFYRMGFTLLQAYGLTECCGGATVTREGEPWTGSVGSPLPGVELKIVPGELETEKNTGVGEVLLSGPIVMQGYLNRPDATAAVLRDGWLHTGDLGRTDSRGRLYIVGRKKDVIVLSSGKNIHPEEIEAHYCRSPFISEVCVLGLSRDQEPSSERLHAVVVPDFDCLREQKIVNSREIVRFEIETLSVSLPSYKRIMSFDVWQTALPRTTTRKLKRFEIERMVQAGRRESQSVAEGSSSLPEEEAAWAAQPEVAPLLTAIAEAAKVTDTPRATTNLELDLGLDSMERVELVAQLEQMAGASIPEEALARVYTVGDLIEALLQGAKASSGEASRSPAWDVLLQEQPILDPEIAALARRRPILDPLLFLVVKTVYVLARVFFRLEARGIDNLPASGAFLLCPNHQSYIDPFFVVSALPYRIIRRVFFVGASEFFVASIMRWAARVVRLIPVDPDANLVRAMRAGAAGLRQGKVLVLFPEGERSIDGTVRKFKKGAAILATHLQVPIVPVALDGLFEAWPRGKSFQKLSKVKVVFGPLLVPPPALPTGASFPEREAAYSSAVERLRGTVVDMWEDLHGSS